MLCILVPRVTDCTASWYEHFCGTDYSNFSRFRNLLKQYGGWLAAAAMMVVFFSIAAQYTATAPFISISSTAVTSTALAIRSRLELS